MSFAIFIVLILGLFIALLNVLPLATSLSFSFTPAVVLITGYMRSWDFLFPIHELFSCVLIVITFELSVWGWHAGYRVVKFIRGHSDGA